MMMIMIMIITIITMMIIIIIIITINSFFSTSLSYSLKVTQSNCCDSVTSKIRLRILIPLCCRRKQKCAIDSYALLLRHISRRKGQFFLNIYIYIYKKKTLFTSKLDFEEETNKMLHLEHGFVWC